MGEGEECGNWVAIGPYLSLQCSSQTRVTPIRAGVRMRMSIGVLVCVVVVVGGGGVSAIVSVKVLRLGYAKGQDER